MFVVVDVWFSLVGQEKGFRVDGEGQMFYPKAQ